MWPFTSRKDKKRIKECEHEFEENIDEQVYPQKNLFENGQPYIYKVKTTFKDCKHCPKTKKKEQTEEKVYLSVDRVEEA